VKTSYNAYLTLSNIESKFCRSGQKRRKKMIMKMEKGKKKFEDEKGEHKNISLYGVSKFVQFRTLLHKNRFLPDDSF
jgi:hypothetical protein